MKTFNELCGFHWNKNAMIARCGGGGNDSSASDNNNDGDSSTNNDGLFDDRDGDGTANIFDFDDGVGWLDTNKDSGTSGGRNFDADMDVGGNSDSRVTASDLSSGNVNTWNNDDGGSVTTSTNITNVDDAPTVNVGVTNNDNPDNSTTTQSNSTVYPDASSSNTTPSYDYGLNWWNDSVSSAVSTAGTSSTSTNTGGGSDSGTDTSTETTTTTTDDDLTNDLLNQIKALQDQINSMDSGGNTIIYESPSSGSSSLPADYLTEADLARYLADLDTGSAAYDPAAFLNAYGFAMDPSQAGNLIGTYLSPDGLYVRRAVRDRETGEIRYVNIPIGAGAMGGNAGLSQFRNERRTGFGTFV